MPRTILVVDDDPHIRDVVAFALGKAGHAVETAADGAEALGMIEAGAPDLVVLDINMPEMDGLELCRQLRRGSDLPILFLSSRDDEIDRVVGLELGADDYVTKPFSPRELTARVAAILKRTAPDTRGANGAANGEGEALEKPISHRTAEGLLVVDTARHLVTWESSPVKLTATEFQLLAIMARQPGRVFDRETLMRGAYPPNIHVSDRTIDSHVRHVRAKLATAGAHGLIETVHGVGVRMTER
ncbi:MAG: response regulator transcription factor [Pseudomonadota bacterium]